MTYFLTFRWFYSANKDVSCLCDRGALLCSTLRSRFALEACKNVWFPRLWCQSQGYSDQTNRRALQNAGWAFVNITLRWTSAKRSQGEDTPFPSPRASKFAAPRWQQPSVVLPSRVLPGWEALQSTCSFFLNAEPPSPGCVLLHKLRFSYVTGCFLTLVR